MAYRIESSKIQGTTTDELVIDGWEKGIADSPYEGIANIQNMNIKYYPGVAYSNYKRQASTIQSTNGVSSNTFTVTVASPAVFTSNAHGLVAGNIVTFTTTGSLPTGLSVGTIYYVVSPGLTTNAFEVSTTSNGSPLNTSGSQSGTHTWKLGTGAIQYSAVSSVGLVYMSDSLGIIYKQNAVNSSIFSVLTGCPGTPNQGLQFWNNYLFAFETTKIHICGDGSGDAGVISSAWDTSTAATGVWPIQSASLSLSGSPVAGDTSATITSYTDAQGTNRAFWNGPTGTYPVRFNFTSGHQYVYASLTQGSAAFTWYPALNSNVSSALGAVQPMQGINVHPSLVSKNDGNLYFGNEQYVSTVQLLANQVFTKGDMNTFNVNMAALSLPPTEVVVAMTELRNLLLVGAFYNIYPWDRFSPQWENPVPMGEKIVQMINILNNVYVFAGIKGNIYLSNGYSVSPFKKIPDYLAGSTAPIDPQWLWGGVMQHRLRLYFQAVAVSAAGTPLIAGTFSIGLNANILMEQPGSIVLENQNSYGLVPTTAVQAGVLVDNNLTSLTYDNYYSGWGNNIGGIDFNDTTLYSANEPLIETDLIPIGTFIQPKTFSNMEFKLDQPMKSGDSITVYARQSLSDTYTQVGTTTTVVLSDFYSPLTFQKFQWIQFKIVVSCNPTATSSSFVRIREIRIR